MTVRSPEANLRGKRALLIGLGQHEGGAGVVRYLARAGAQVTVTDRRDAAALDAAMRSLDGLDVRYILGGHEGIRVREYDLVVRNPAVPSDAPLLREARWAGIPVEMEMTLFLAACPAPMASDPVSPMKTCAGWALYQRKQISAPTIVKQKATTCSCPCK